MNFMDGSFGFEDPTLMDNSLAFGIETSYGRMEFELDLTGDSISGQGKLFGFKLDTHGKRSGGTDMESGRALPEFRRIEPLTKAEESNLIGGEACMWTEMADGFTIESRIWPRAAAIAGILFALFYGVGGA